MTDLRNQRRMASQVLGVGETSVWIDPLHAEDVAAAVTRGDVRSLIGKGHIRKLQAQGVSRGRARALAISKAKGKRKGPGSREGASTAQARNPSKQRWMRTIRPLRQTLAILREDELIDAPTYRLYYRRAKGGVFRSRPHLLSHLVTDGKLTEAQARDVRAKAEAARAAQFGMPAPGSPEAQARLERKLGAQAAAKEPKPKEAKPKKAKAAKNEEGEQ